MNTSDPIGKAILDFHKTGKPKDIIVSSDLTDDDIIPIEVLFRSYEEMPHLEKRALAMTKGRVLDIGAGAGPHSSYLMNQGYTVKAIDSSPGAVEYLKNQGIEIIQTETYDEDLHEVISILPIGEKKVVDVVSKGYTIDGKPFRYPKIILGE